MNNARFVKIHFNDCSKQYDYENEKSYCGLCNEILLHHLQKGIFQEEKFEFIDLSCGTEGW